MVPVVRVDPAGFELEVQQGETLAEAAWRLGYYWPTTCWGQAECMLCHVLVVEGEAETEPPEDEELSHMDSLMPSYVRKADTRLACRLKVRGGGVVVEKKGVRAPK